MKARILKTSIAWLLASLAALLAGCGGGDDGGGIFAGVDDPAPQPVVRTFWAYDFSAMTDYQLQADRVGEGNHCYVYVEQGRAVPQATVNALVAAFDAQIYPGDTGAFGSEPNPGIDNDAKISILLLDIRDGYATPSDSYVGGYFDTLNEFLQSSLPPGFYSNEAEMFYMDIYPSTVGDSQFLRTLAHEFQHMIHFNQESVSKGGVDDDQWLNEAMSEIASVYCGYGPDYERMYVFQASPFNSLTIWDGTVYDYGVAYMWAQYVKDRTDPASGNSVFWRMLHGPDTGIASVNAALTDVGYGKDFGGVFRDWAVANYSGNAVSWPGHPEWSYTTVNTWPGIYPLGGGYWIELPGMFGFPAWTNVNTLFGLEPWSVDYYLYTPLAGNTGSVTWTAANPAAWASLGDNTTLSFGLASGTPYPYTGKGYLIVANPSDNFDPVGDNVAYASRRVRPATAAAMLAEARRDPAVRRLAAMTGRPVPLCVHPYLREKARPVAGRGARTPR